MITENLSTLKIYQLTQKQYDERVASNNIDPNALYVTPDEALDLSGYAEAEHVHSDYETKTDANAKLTEAKSYTDESLVNYAEKEHSHEIADVTGLQEHINTSVYIDIEDNEDVEDPYGGNSSASIDVDDALSDTSENPVQNKVITEKFNELENSLIGVTKSVNGFIADDNGEVTIEYDVGTDRKYRHDELPALPKTIELYKNDIYTNNPYVFLGKNYWPSVEYVDGNKFEKHGVTFETDTHNITLKGTATAGGSYILTTGPEDPNYHEIDGMFEIGDTLYLYVFCNVSEYTSPFVKFGLYDENESRIAYKQVFIEAGKNFGSANLTVPEGTKFVRFDIAYNNGNTYNSTVFPVLVKGGTIVINNGVFSDELAEVTIDSETNILCTAPYESVVLYKMGLKEYIDNKSNTIDFDMVEIEKTMSFVTPEMFGAYGDNVHDDTSAVQECIDYAIANSKKMIGGGTYMTSAPIIISTSAFVCDINRIMYSGTDSAVIVSGEMNTLRFSWIKSSNGVGLRLLSDRATCYNNIYISWLQSKGNCIEYIATVSSLVGNTLTFERLESTGGANCIYQSDKQIGINHNNNNFIGGKLQSGNWGVYGAKGNDTYTTCQFEGVKNGICHTGTGTCRVIAPRYAELKLLAIDYDDSKRPLVDGQGVVLAVNTSPDWLVSSDMRQIGFYMSPHDQGIYPQSIDVSNAIIEFNNTTETSLSKFCTCLVDAPLYTRWTDKIADEFYVFGRHLIIKNPCAPKTLTVTKNDAGYLGDYRTTDSDSEFNIYERFIISESECDYTLPPSYDWIGFREFTVNQPEGTSCTFRDWRGTIIFNGADYGAGTYKVIANCHHTTGNPYPTDYYDNRNQVWDIVKQDADSESKVSLPKSNNTVNYGEAGQFAVSDGNGGITWRTLFEGEEVAY